MKKRIAVLICLFVISFPVVPVWGHDYKSNIGKELKIGTEIVTNINQLLSYIELPNNDSDKIIPLLKPKTSGANISPFSSKNLPLNKDFKVPDEELQPYKDILANIPENKRLSIGIITNNFIKTLATKKNPIENIKADMKLKGLKGKEYIFSIGQWSNYIKYLKENL